MKKISKKTAACMLTTAFVTSSLWRVSDAYEYYKKINREETYENQSFY